MSHLLVPRPLNRKCDSCQASSRHCTENHVWGQNGIKRLVKKGNGVEKRICNPRVFLVEAKPCALVQLTGWWREPVCVTRWSKRDFTFKAWESRTLPKFPFYPSKVVQADCFTWQHNCVIESKVTKSVLKELTLKEWLCPLKNPVCQLSNVNRVRRVGFFKFGSGSCVETRPNWARKVREMILFSVLCTVYCGRGCVSLESERGKELA